MTAKAIRLERACKKGRDAFKRFLLREFKHFESKKGFRSQVVDGCFWEQVTFKFDDESVALVEIFYSDRKFSHINVVSITL